MLTPTASHSAPTASGASHRRTRPTTRRASSSTGRRARKKFNGTVVVEWLNVSGGVDAAPDWTFAHTELIREGYAWVGVSAQKRRGRRWRGAGPGRQPAAQDGRPGALRLAPPSGRQLLVRHLLAGRGGGPPPVGPEPARRSQGEARHRRGRIAVGLSHGRPTSTRSTRSPTSTTATSSTAAAPSARRSPSRRSRRSPCREPPPSATTSTCRCSSSRPRPTSRSLATSRPGRTTAGTSSSGRSPARRTRTPTCWWTVPAISADHRPSWGSS